MGEVVTGHVPAQSSRKFSGLPLRIKPIGLWYTSLEFPKGIGCDGSATRTTCSLTSGFPCSPFNQRATFSPPPAIVTTAVARSTTLVPTVTIGPLLPTIATTVTISTSIRATGTGTTTIGRTASPSGRSPKHLQASGLFLS